jgi:hypothetical protein
MIDKENKTFVLDSGNMQSLLDALTRHEYRLFGPTIEQGAVVYDEIHAVADFPIGWIDRQDAGSYRLVKSKKRTFFGYVVGPHSWKKLLHPPVEKLWQAERDGRGFAVTEETHKPAKTALIGVRPCELRALAIHDKVLMEGPYANRSYEQRRRNLFIVAVNCVRPGGTCFCVSMKAGPKAESGFDLALTEILESDRHYFVVEVGTDAGADLLDELPVKDAGEGEIAAAAKAMEQAEVKMGRSLDVEGIKELLYDRFDDTHWDDVADRCLSCGNCTMVCPTCFCVDVEDTTDLSGRKAERWSRWDSCFTRGFSYIHGGSIRFTRKSRYRQWMTHKLGYWLDQFDTLGCVGCGRCITWCPAGIDITEEARAIRDKYESIKA